MPGKSSHVGDLHPVIRFLSSVQLAVPLLGAIAAVLIWTTLYESRVGSDIVQREIYKSGWFGLLMFLLAVNLSVSALTRFPWKGARKIGFALTHFGLVVLIAGSAAVIHVGVEGMLPLRTDVPASGMLRLQGELLEILKPDGTTDAVDIAVTADGSIAPHQAGDLKLLDYQERTLEVTRFSPNGTSANPALHLSMTSQNMGQAVDEWLAATPSSAQQVNLGPATLKLAIASSEAERQAMLTPPPNTGGEWGSVTIATPAGQQEFDVKTSVGSTLQLPGQIQVEVANFWPDFRLNSRNEPETASDQLRNPALQLQVKSPSGVERWFVFGRQELEPVRTVVSGTALDAAVTYQAPVPKDNAFTAIALANSTSTDGDLYYTVNSSKGFRSGQLRVGEPVDLGWADFQLTVTEWLPQARIEKEVVNASGPEGSNNALPAILVESAAGKQQWLQWGVPQTLDGPNGSTFAVYSPKSMELPFSVALKDFIVDRNEGSESVAMWTSKIRIDDPALGTHAFRKVWMNHPTWYRGWKIAQASWNPGDLRQTTLQVKREPAWVTALTWTGSLLVVVGIGVMFYGQELSKRYRKLTSRFSPPPATTTPQPDSETLSPASNQPAIDSGEFSPQASS